MDRIDEIEMEIEQQDKKLKELSGHDTRLRKQIEDEIDRLRCEIDTLTGDPVIPDSYADTNEI